MIGFFDSGLGGLTILREVMKQIPGNYLYLGDNARAPYGLRSSEEVRRYTTEGVAWLIDQGCSLIVLACNTASANALRFLQQEWLPAHAPHVRVLGILVPTVEAITGVKWHEERESAEGSSVLVFATPSTVTSGAYEREITKRLPKAMVEMQACPELVPLVEKAAPIGALKEAVKRYVDEAVSRMQAPPDAVLLGCTHYTLIEKIFQECLPSSVNVLSQPTIVTRALSEYLDRHPDLVAKQTKSSVRFATTGNPDLVEKASQHFFPSAVVHYEQVVITD